MHEFLQAEMFNSIPIKPDYVHKQPFSSAQPGLISMHHSQGMLSGIRLLALGKKYCPVQNWLLNFEELKIQLEWLSPNPGEARLMLEPNCIFERDILTIWKDFVDPDLGSSAYFRPVEIIAFHRVAASEDRIFTSTFCYPRIVAISACKWAREDISWMEKCVSAFLIRCGL